MGVFLMDRRRWVKAAAHHFEAWERKERDIFARMTPRISDEGIAMAGRYYRVARHFPQRGRRKLVAMIENVAPLRGTVEQRFDGFVREVRSLAGGFALRSDADGRRLRPISGMSKFLWYRFPMQGFIYDSQVLAAVCRNGLTVRFDSMIRGFGGNPSDSGEWSFMIAASSYRTFALPLHAIIADVFGAQGLDPARAARLVDALFWLEGSSAAFKQPKSESDRAIARAVGEEAFTRCAATLEALLHEK